MPKPEDDRPVGGMIVIPLNFCGRDLDEQVGPVVNALVDTLPAVHRLYLVSRLLVVSCGVDPEDLAAVNALANAATPVTQRLHQWMDEYRRSPEAQRPDDKLDARPIYAALGQFISFLLDMAMESAQIEPEDLETLMRAMHVPTPGWSGMAPEMQA